jgi:type IV secretion system protein VirD4
VSELLGKETLDTNTYGKSSGRSGSYSTNYQNAGRELLTPDEVRMLDNHYAILFIRGERPIMDKKFDILLHPNVRKTADGKEEPFRHGIVSNSVVSFTVDENISIEELPELKVPSVDYILLSEEDVEKLFDSAKKEG